jgi:hypothetical protein
MYRVVCLKPWFNHYQSPLRFFCRSTCQYSNQQLPKNGFVAQNQEQEIEAKGLKIRITDSYEDVSAKILNAVANISDPVERINTIKRKQQELVKQAEKEDPTIKAEVSEMFIGKKLCPIPL